jgi:hypothetical protein
MQAPEFRGSILVMMLYDVCEEIDLALLQQQISGDRQASVFKHATPEYVRFERPPVIEPAGSSVLPSGEHFSGTIRFYDFGVISVLLRTPFTGTWQELQQLGSRLVGGNEVDLLALALVKEKVGTLRSVLRKPYERWLSEDYYVFHLLPSEVTASELLQASGAQIARLVNGETATLSEAEQRETLREAISYYSTDLLVAGWNAAFIYDTETGAESSVRLLEYANSQLLEFRHYDEVLSRELHSAYRFLERKRGAISAWRMRAAATRLRTLSLEVVQLAERTTNALKFVGDMFSARLYKMSAAEMGVNEYQALVHEKLRTADELYSFMIEQFHQARGFLLEIVVVIILMIELFFAFRGGR